MDKFKKEETAPAVVIKDPKEKTLKKIRVIAREIQHRGIVFFNGQVIDIDESSADYHIKQRSAVAV